MSPAPPVPVPVGAPPRGFALLLVLILVPVAFVLVVELFYQSTIEFMAASNVSDLSQLEYAIDGQFEIAVATLKYDKKQNEIDSEGDEWNRVERRTRSDQDVALSMRVFDEGGKFHLSRLTTGSEAQQKRAREELTRLLDVFREGVAGEPNEGGDLDAAYAEDLVEAISKYLKREGASGEVPKPKTSTPGVPLLLDELVFADPKRIPPLLVDHAVRDRVAPGLHRFVTCWGAGKINLNTAPLALLQALFANLGDRGFAQAIVDRRRSAPDPTKTPTSGSSSSTGSGSSTTDEAGNPFTEVTQLTDGSVQGLTNEVLQRNGIDVSTLDVRSDHFGVRIKGETKRTKREELYVIERVRSEGFRLLLHQERVDPLLETEADTLETDDTNVR